MVKISEPEATYMSQQLNQQLNEQATVIIECLQQKLKEGGLSVHLHFELEGVFKFSDGEKLSQTHLDFINQALVNEKIPGKLVTEFWSNQWEYVSLFAGQSPLQEAQCLTNVISLLPNIASQVGISETVIKPVIWCGDTGQMASGSKQIFNATPRAVHIPNAIQINVSVSDSEGQNLVANSAIGEFIQAKLMESSFECALFFLPEEDAFERLKLKTKYGLSAELCSPDDISGGHQGSIALYRKVGKHNQPLGCEPILYDHRNTVIAQHENWQATARVEHRLGAASELYNVYINVLYVLLNVYEAVNDYNQQKDLPAVLQATRELPISLFDTDGELGAISVFEHSTWFSNAITSVMRSSENDCGEHLKSLILSKYQKQRILI